MQRRNEPTASPALVRGAAALVGVLLAAGDARADWPMARHDAHRTGMSPGKSNIKKPKPRWSSYLGGSIRADGLLAHDLDGDGRAEIIHATGGAVAAKRPDDSLIWRARVYGTGVLVGVADLDGDGQDELVVHTSHNLYLLDVKTGAVRWAQPDGEMGVIAPYVRLVPRSGGLDLIIPECGGCGGSKTLVSGFRYSFAKGFDAPLRTPLPMTIGVTSVLTVAKGSVPGTSLLLINDDDKANNPPSNGKVNLLDGETGAVLLPAGFDIHQNTALVTCAPGDIDGSPGDEILCLASPGQGGDTVFALSWKGSSLVELWSHVAAQGEVFHNQLSDLLVDLDGNGTLEVALSISHADGSYSTRLLAAETGAPITSYLGLRYSGVAFLGGQGKPTVIANNEAQMGGLAFDGSALTLLFTIADQRPVLEPDAARKRRQSASPLRVITADLDGDALPELITWRLSKTPVISGYSIKGGAPAPLASLPFPDDVSPTSLWALPPVDRPFPQIAIARTDGVLHLLDQALQPTAAAIRFGGYYSPGEWGQLGQTGVIASLDGGPAQQILFTDSKGALRRIDADGASLDTPPITRWEVRGASHPLVVPGLDGGAPAIATFARLPPPSKDSTVRVVRGATGESLWEVPIPEQPINDLVMARLTLGDTPDLVFQTPDPAQPGLVRTRALSGDDGASLWSFSEKPGNCGLQPAGVSIADWNQDGYDDVVQQASFTRVNSGADGSSLVVGTVGGCYFLPAIVDPDGDGVDNVLLQGGFESITLLTHGLDQQVFASTDGDRPYPYGALAECPFGQVWVEGSWRDVSRLKITRLSGPEIGAATTLFLAGGARYPDQEAVLAARAGQGQLTAASVHGNLAGDGVPVAVIGSGDGWLYGVEPCSGELRFALDFAYSVGEPFFGDTDGDGLDEIIVSVADGNLYALVDDPDTGAGGMGGAGGAGGAGGMGGAGGAGGERGPWPKLYGRAGCYCQAPEGGATSALPVALLALGAALSLARRGRQGRRARRDRWERA
jgi:hypothetical protein